MSDEINDPQILPENVGQNPAVTDNENGAVAEQKHGNNDYFREMMERNFLDYASYVIGSRAIPDVDDGLKPVQRRILWALYQSYDGGRTTKTANIVGNTMHYHPHGDASIGDAIVVLANKGGCIEENVTDKNGEKTVYTQVPYYIKKQGNFGNILTGSPAAAARYTECSLTKLAYETLFNNDITPFIPNYDGRKKEPVVLPAKVPSLLMLGSDGIAVGMSTTILPHNFNELIDAEIAELKGEEFRLYPDFQQGGVMDVREYDDGNGKIILRAKIDIEGRELVIREIPAVCTTESLINSIEKAAEKNKIRISGVDNFTTDHVEIRITPTRGYDPEKTRQGLFMYTDCSVSISPKMIVICDRKPVQMSVTAVLKRNVQKLLDYLKRELEIELDRMFELRHSKTLAQIFFENRIYKRIEECKDEASEYREVMEGLAPFTKDLFREITKEDIDRLLALPVRRIARFDIEKNQRELKEIAANIKNLKNKLAHLVDVAIEYLESIKEKYGKDFPRHTEIEKFEQIDRSQAALNNIKIGWDRRNGYVGTAVKSDDIVVCNEFDRFICIEKNGNYRVIPLPPEKLFVNKLYDFRKYDTKTEYGIVYRDKKSGKYYCKRSCFGGYILEKEYHLIPPGAVLELFTPRSDAIYLLNEIDGKGREKKREINLMEFPLRSVKARGVLLTGNKIQKLTHQRYLTPEELAEILAAQETAAPTEDEEKNQAENAVADSVAHAADGIDISDENKEKEITSVEPEVAESEVAESQAVPAETPVRKNGRKRQVPAAPPEEPAIPVKAAEETVPAGSASVEEAAPEKSSEPSGETPQDEKNDDEFGIVQPEFGF